MQKLITILLVLITAIRLPGCKSTPVEVENLDPLVHQALYDTTSSYYTDFSKYALFNFFLYSFTGTKEDGDRTTRMERKWEYNRKSISLCCYMFGMTENKMIILFHCNIW